MTQKNVMSARALAMEELENVNGGKMIITGFDLQLNMRKLCPKKKLK